MGLTTAGHTTSVYLLPGMSVKLKATHFFIKDTEVKHRYKDGSSKTITPINGFVVDSDKVGEIEAVSGEPAVIYKHKKAESNTITFYALTGERGRVDVTSVPIHDHSTIVGGGPAHGSYFSDAEEEAEG
jgi:hypothetical protein